MLDGDAALLERARYQQCAMAVQRLLLAAHQGDAALVRCPHYAPHAVIEQVRFRQASIVDAPVLVVARPVRRPAAQLSAQEHVIYAGPLQRAAENAVVELGIVAAGRRRADVHYFVHAVFAQQIQERFRRVVRVADCENLVLCVVQWSPDVRVR